MFSLAYKGKTLRRLTDKQLDEISEIDVIPWSSGDMNFTQTKVFIERFFNKVPTARDARTVWCEGKHNRVHV